MALRQKIETATSAILALCALAITLMLARSQFFPNKVARGGLQPEHEDEWQRYAVSSMRIGPEKAAVTITEFSDFQCPACYRLFRALETVRAHYRSDVAIVYRNYPLTDLHPFARKAAIAASCAAAQGRFAEYHDYLFTHHDSLASVNWTALAARLGVADTTKFGRCLTSPEAVAQLADDSLAATALDIPGTPLVLVNGWLYRGAPSPTALDTVIARELRVKTRLAATGR